MKSCRTTGKVFVTDGNQRATLALTRSLGRRGIQVLVGDEKRHSLASSSRYCAGHVTYPSPYQYPESFYLFLLDFLKETSFEMVIPITDVTTHLVLLHKKEFEEYVRLPLPEFETFDFISNKWRLLKHAEEVGIPIPRTHFVVGPEALKEIRDQLHYPLVVKASRSRILTQEGWLLTGVDYARSEQELLQCYERREYLRYPSIVQERIVGPGIGLFVLCNQGNPTVAFSHRRLREKPPSGGVSVLRESIAVDPRLENDAIRLLKPLGWHGVAMLEYKLDERTGQRFLIEVNGRFWGSLQLAMDAGIDFPYLLYQMARDDEMTAPQAYRIGVKSRWLLGDLDHLLLRLLKRDQALNLPEGFPSRAKTLVQFVKFYEPETYYEILSLKDFRPFVYELSQYLTNLFPEKGSHE